MSAAGEQRVPVASGTRLVALAGVQVGVLVGGQRHHAGRPARGARRRRSRAACARRTPPRCPRRSPAHARRRGEGSQHVLRFRSVAPERRSHPTVGSHRAPSARVAPRPAAPVGSRAGPCTVRGRSPTRCGRSMRRRPAEPRWSRTTPAGGPSSAPGHSPTCRAPTVETTLGRDRRVSGRDRPPTAVAAPGRSAGSRSGRGVAAGELDGGDLDAVADLGRLVAAPSRRRRPAWRRRRRCRPRPSR